jgi:hypothetical protein
MSELKTPFHWKRLQIVDRRALVRLAADTRRWDVRLVGLQFETLPQPTRLAIGLFVAERLLAEADDVFGAIR